MMLSVELFRKSVAKELEKKARLGHYAVLCRDGKPVRVYADEIKKLLGIQF